MTPLNQLTDDEFAHRLHSAVQALPDAPEQMQRAALGLWPTSAPASQAAGALKALVGGMAQHVLAALTFDSWAAAPATALGMRSLRSATRHLLYNAQGRDIDLRVSAASGAFALAGQVLGPDESGVVTLTPQAGEPLTATLDALGEFRIDGVPAGNYRLTLHLGGDEIQLPPLDVGAPSV